VLQKISKDFDNLDKGVKNLLKVRVREGWLED